MAIERIGGTVVSVNGKRFTIAVENDYDTEYIPCVIENERLLTLVNIDRRFNGPFSFKKGAKVFIHGSMKVTETVLPTSFTGVTRKVHTFYFSPDIICVKDVSGKPRNLLRA